MNSYQEAGFYSPIRKTIHVTLLLACILGSHGCLSTTHRIERHLAANPNRPEAVIQALHDGDRIVLGMVPDEVRLIMGPPARIESEGGDSLMVWHYDKARRRDDALRSSAMWTLPIPFRTIIFDANNHEVQKIINYDEAESVSQPVTTESASTSETTSTSETASTDRRDAPLQSPPPPAPASVPAYRPNPDELNVYGWPSVTLQGLTSNGTKRNAVLNGTLLEPGESVGAVRLEAIYANGVVLEYRTQRAFLRPGESTGQLQEKGQP